MSSSDIFLHQPERLNHAVSITLGQQFVHSRHNRGREGVNKLKVVIIPTDIGAR